MKIWKKFASTPLIAAMTFSAGFAARFLPAVDQNPPAIAKLTTPGRAAVDPSTHTTLAPPDASRLSAADLLGLGGGDRIIGILDHLSDLSAADLKLLAKELLSDRRSSDIEDSEEFEVLQFLLLARWSELAPEAAGRFMRSDAYHGYQYSAGAWAELNPDWEAALEDYEVRPQDGQNIGEINLLPSDRWRQWADENRQEATEWLRANDWIEPIDESSMADLDDPFANSAAIEDPNAHHNIKYKAVLESLLDQDLEVVMEPISRLGEIDLISAVVKKRYFHDAGETIAWLEEVDVPEWDSSNSASWGTAVAQWYDQDAQAASEWLASQQDPSIRTSGIKALIQRLTTGPTRNYQTAETWAEFADENTRPQLLKQIAAQKLGKVKRFPSE